MRLLSRLIPRSTGGRWALGTGLAAVVGVGIYLVFFVFAFHLIFVDEVVDEEGPEFAVEADIDALISEALDTAGSEAASGTADAGEPDESGDAGTEPIPDESMTVSEHPDHDETAADDPAADAPEADEPSATAPATTAAPPPTATEAEQGVRVAYVGSFGPRFHPAEGTAVVLTDGTQTFLRFDDDFATDNGPDLNVYLHTAGPDASVGDLVGDFIDLGDLKGNIGAQNYVVPADIDLDRYNTVSVWCVRFRVVFGTAELVPMN